MAPPTNPGPEPKQCTRWSTRSVVCVRRPVDKGLHPAIVLDPRTGGALVVSGTRNRRHGEFLVLAPGTREFAATRVLREATYFHKDALWLVRNDEIYEWAIWLDGAPVRNGMVPVKFMDSLRAEFQDRIAAYDGMLPSAMVMATEATTDRAQVSPGSPRGK